jgi:hypothetical protein
MTQPVYIRGDIHGHYDKLVTILHDANLIDGDRHWSAGEATLWFLGDFFDRGPHGIDVLNLVMRLQREAWNAGGRVAALIGNHEIQLLAAYKFGEVKSTGPGKNFLADWKRNGGIARDLDQLTPEHVDWLLALPAMAHEQDRLLIHADARLYPRYGDSVAAVNEALTTLFESDDTEAWDKLLAEFSEHKAFIQNAREGAERAADLLAQFGGAQIIHGHSPISTTNWKMARCITEPLIYADNRCINVDGGLYLGGPGFIYELPPVLEPTTPV